MDEMEEVGYKGESKGRRGEEEGEGARGYGNRNGTNDIPEPSSQHSFDSSDSPQPRRPDHRGQRPAQ
jgi:hypothetical protein